jgi:hypothetical protein
MGSYRLEYAQYLFYQNVIFTSFIWIMAKDRRYTRVKNLMSGGHIRSFQDIFLDIPKSVVARDLGITFTIMLRMLSYFIHLFANE